jgi:DNA-binding CsgD family transcriptional regulator
MIHDGARHDIWSDSSSIPSSLIAGILETLKKKAKLSGQVFDDSLEAGACAHLLHERIKELTTLYKALRVVQDSAKSSSEVLQDIVGLLPPAWQYPEITAAPWVQSAPIHTTAGQHGTIEVVYLEQKPQEMEGPFLAEERDLLNSLASSVSSYLDRKHVETALRQTLERIQALSPPLMRVQEQGSKQFVRECLHHGGSKSTVGQVLTPRQREILQLIAEGHSTKDMAQRLSISVKTIETHRMDIKHRLGIHDVAGLVRYAIRVGLITSES